jgi:predicted Zn-dependent protease
MTLVAQDCQPLSHMQPLARDADVEAGARFCDGCGSPNRATARFCAHCGNDLPAVEHSSPSPVELARRLSASGERLQARTVLEDALGSDGSNDQVRLSYAAMLLQGGEWEAGLGHLEQLSPQTAALPVVQAYIGGALLGLNRVSDAKDVLDDAFAASPRDFYVLLKRGELYCRLGIYQTAVQTLEQAAAADCNDPLARDVVRRLLRFARDKNRSGFVRSWPVRPFRLSFKPHLPLPRRRSTTVWGT